MARKLPEAKKVVKDNKWYAQHAKTIARRKAVDGFDPLLESNEFKKIIHNNNRFLKNGIHLAIYPKLQRVKDELAKITGDVVKVAQALRIATDASIISKFNARLFSLNNRMAVLEDKKKRLEEKLEK